MAKYLHTSNAYSIGYYTGPVNPPAAGESTGL